jgi:hypothetical protein
VARELARTPQYQQSRRDRKKVEMLFARLKRILKVDRLRLRGLNGAHDDFFNGTSLNGQSPVAGVPGTLTLTLFAAAMEKLSSANPKCPQRPHHRWPPGWTLEP